MARLTWRSLDERAADAITTPARALAAGAACLAGAVLVAACRYLAALA